MRVETQQTGFDGLILIKPTVFPDKRGYFFESFNAKTLLELGIDDLFVQDNQSRSSFGVLRGLHFQKPPFAQSKLVRVLSGVILDVVVDLRLHSPTFGKHFCTELSSDNMWQLYVPKGFAHGFLVLSDSADLFYKCDAFYCKEKEGGLFYNDPHLQIDWKLKPEQLIISDKDLHLPHLADVEPF
ncbi:MAG: dTDP-4-dehydrorhamnose 3,5-epimerase [Cyclobacteriaceae bacterium]|nr:dTDP-4-dehydrorhamnose 3,5-epimerase [Cyclobacteriaceae bacterium]